MGGMARARFLRLYPMLGCAFGLPHFTLRRALQQIDSHCAEPARSAIRQHQHKLHYLNAAWWYFSMFISSI
jgi:hypothetical protein